MKTVALKTAKESAPLKKERVSAPIAVRSISIGTGPWLQRKADCACGGDCPRCEEEANARKIQTKLAVSSPGDQFEREADMVADQIMGLADPAFSSSLSVLNSTQTVGRVIQRRADGPSGGDVAADFNSSLGSGMPLDAASRTYFEPRFGQNFSEVRVHADSRAAELARSVNARAYTIGRDIVFGAGQYAPASPDGRRLIAHELTHTIQQRGASAPVSLQRQPQSPPPGQSAQPAPTGGAQATSSAATIKAKKLDTPQNIDDLAGILFHETRGQLPIPVEVAIGWIVLNRMLILNTNQVGSLIGGNQLAKLAGAPLYLKYLAQMLLSGQYEDTTNGSFFYVMPKIMPDAANQGCCTGKTGSCNTLQFQSGVDCQGGLQTVPGTQPPEQRFFPSFGRASKRQNQPDGTDPMTIQVFQR